MSPESNTQLIQSIYANFAKGNIPAILASLSDDVQWEEYAHPQIPYAGKRRGKPAVLEFFQQLSQIEVASFEPQQYSAAGDRVFVAGRWSGRVTPTGKFFATEWLMVWTLQNNQVTAFRSYDDTAALATAFKP